MMQRLIMQRQSVDDSGGTMHVGRRAGVALTFHTAVSANWRDKELIMMLCISQSGALNEGPMITNW